MEMMQKSWTNNLRLDSQWNMIYALLSASTYGVPSWSAFLELIGSDYQCKF